MNIDVPASDACCIEVANGLNAMHERKCVNEGEKRTKYINARTK